MGKKALISTVQGYATKDGPGLRTTVFFVGCNLHCAWCSNPELMAPGIKFMHFKERCTKQCVNIEINNVSRPEAFESIGYAVTVEELFQKLIRDKVFFDTSGGGVTLSGGEPAMYHDFIIELAVTLHAAGIHVALDTAGHYAKQRMLELANVFDLFLYDIKAFDNAIHEKCTGLSNYHILENVRLLADLGKNIIIRMVIVPGYNDDFLDIVKRVDFVVGLGTAVKRLDILRYHSLGAGKYARLGLFNPISEKLVCDETLIRKICAYAQSRNLAVYVE